MLTRWKFQIGLIAIAIVFAVLTGSVFGEHVVYAQRGDNGYVDVGLILEVPDQDVDNRDRGLNIIVVNHGSRTAYDVEVVVNIVYPEASSYFLAPGDYHLINPILEVPVGSVSQEGDRYSLKWSIPAIGGLQREALEVRVIHAALTRDTVKFDNKLYPHEHYGKVTTSSFESNLHKGNNTARVWSYSYSGTFHYQAAGNYSVSVSVDQPYPSPEGTVNFTITTNRENPYSGTGYSFPPPPIDLKVAIDLTDGLSVSGTPTYAPTTNALSYSNGVFNVGTLKRAGDARMNSVTLPITVASNAAGSRQCLTATLTGNPPPGVGPYDDDISDNMASVCIGPAPAGTQVALREGTVDLFTWYDCVGKTAAPCNGDDSLELVVLNESTSTRRHSILNPDQVVIHIPDTVPRIDSTNGSLSWSTGFLEIESSGNVVRKATPGVRIFDNPTLMDRTSTSDDPDWWGELFRYIGDNTQYRGGEIRTGTFKVPEGALVYNYFVESNDLIAFFDYEAANPLFQANKTYNKWPLGYDWAHYPHVFEFTKLGTYELPITITAAYDRDGPGAADPVSPQPSDTETYTFHVGPIQDMGVRAGDNNAAAAGQTAFTILASNNGPEHSADATVKVALPSGALVERYVASDGTYSNGAWTIPGLKLRDYRRSQGLSEEARLTLILKEGIVVPTEPATATISLTDNSYTVCIASDRSTLAHDNETDCVAVTGASWHESTVYDYPDNNNTAKITAQRGGGVSGTRGTAAGGPMAPRFANTPVLSWEAVPHVNNWPVHRYQVQYLNGDNWLDLAEVASSQTHFADMASGSGRAYRVRALNEAGVPGFWSRSAAQVSYRQASPPLNVSALAGQPGEVVVSWDASSDDGGSTITYYQVQWSRSGAGGWSNACRTENAFQLTCTNTGIPSGETRYYRVAAYAGGLGAWSDLAVATTVSGVPEAPRLSASDATSGSGENVFRAIRLTWNEPRDHGSPIYAYEIQYAEYDTDARACGDDWQYLGSVGDQYSGTPPREYTDNNNHNGLWPGVTRCYRVSAINSAGHGAWSNVVQHSTGAVPPDEWVYLNGEADGQNAITLYWGEPHFDGGAPVTGYQLQYAEDQRNDAGELNWRNLTSTGASVRSYTHTGRKVGETWHYRIRARNSAGWGGWSYTASVTIDAGATADISQPSLTVQARTSTEVLLSWNSLCNPNKEGDCEDKNVDGYYVEYSEDGGLYGWERLASSWTDQTKYIDSTVEPGATRYYRVAGYQEVNRRHLYGRWSQVKKATTADFVVGAPQNFTIVAEGERALKLEWDAVTAGRDASSITGYRIERTTDGGDDTSWAARQTNRRSSPYVETSLTPDTYYCYRVAAVTRNGRVPYIGPYSFECALTPRPGS